MSYQVSSETVNRTTRCLHDHACLTSDGWEMCRLERKLEGNGAFIASRVRNFCPYVMSFGDDYICNCPTRLELYDRYHV